MGTLNFIWERTPFPQAAVPYKVIRGKIKGTVSQDFKILQIFEMDFHQYILHSRIWQPKLENLYYIF